MKNYTCAEVFESLIAYLANELSDDIRQAIEAHMASCPDCQIYLKTYREVVALSRACCQIECNQKTECDQKLADLAQAVMATPAMPQARIATKTDVYAALQRGFANLLVASSMQQLPATEVSKHWSQPDSKPVCKETIQTTGNLPPAWLQTLQNKAARLDERIEALHEGLTQDPVFLAPYVVSALEEQNLPQEWLDALVFAAEELQFRGAYLRYRLKNRLHRLALQLKDEETDGSRERVVWSALRTWMSMIELEELPHLAPFLKRGKAVDTRLVVLKGLPRIFADTPPSQAYPALADRAAELAIAYLHPDVLTPGPNSAMAQAAIHALAVLGDERTADILDQLLALDKLWLTQQLGLKLQETLDVWTASGTQDDLPGVRFLCEQLAHLKKEVVGVG